MAYENGKKIGPPKFLVWLFLLLTPRSFRLALETKAAADYASLPQYLSEMGALVPRTILSKSIEAFDIRRMFGDLALTYVAFFAAPFATVGAALFVTALTLFWRDGHSHPASDEPKEALLDGVLAAGAIAVSQVLFFFLAPALVIPWSKLKFCLYLTLAFLGLWRFISRMRDPKLTPAEKDYRDAWVINAAFLLALIAIIRTSAKIVPTDLSIVFGFLPITIWFIGLRLQSDRIGALAHDDLLSLNQRQLSKGVLAKVSRLFKPFRMALAYRSSAPFDIALFPSMTLPMLYALYGLYSGRTDIYWMQFAADTLAVVVLWKLWQMLKQINGRVAAALIAQADAGKNEGDAK